MKKNRGLEVLIIIVVIAAAMGVFIWRRGQVKAVNQAALIEELRAIRAAVAAYVEINKNYPPDLKTLVSGKFALSGGERPYFAGNIKLDKNGNPVDAFGKNFNYDAATGRVWPSEPEYADW